MRYISGTRSLSLLKGINTAPCLSTEEILIRTDFLHSLSSLRRLPALSNILQQLVFKEMFLT